MLGKIFGLNFSRVKAVHDSDISNYLHSLGVLNEVLAGNRTCMQCEGAISLENIEVIVPRKDKVAFACSKEDCSLSGI